MMFLPAVGIKDTDTTYTGMQVAFGYTEVTKLPIIGTEIKATIFNFSFMNMLTYILALVGVVFSILAALGKGSKFANFVAARAYSSSSPCSTRSPTKIYRSCSLSSAATLKTALLSLTAQSWAACSHSSRLLRTLLNS